MTDSQVRPDTGPVDDPSATEAERDAQETNPAADEPQWPSEHPESGEQPLLACTVTSAAWLSSARVLRESFLRHHPTARFVTLLLDGPTDSAPDVITPADIGVEEQEFARWAMALNMSRLSAMLRPRLLSHLLARSELVLHFEPWVQVCGSVAELFSGLTTQRPVALLPRTLRPLFADGLRPGPADLAESGAYDPSLFAVSHGAEQLLTAWTEQVRTAPTESVAFLDSVPTLTDHHVVRDPGVGLSVWNAAQRTCEAVNGQHTVDGVPLRSVHFEGFQPQRPWLFSATYSDRPRVLLSEHPELAGLCAAYRNALIAAGYTGKQQDGFDALPDGTPLPAALRQQYLTAWRAADANGEEPPASPFSSDPGAVDEFVDWACAPADERQRSAGACRWTLALWDDDAMLRQEYPDPLGADAEAFYEWCAGVGVASGRVPAAAVRRRGSAWQATLVDQLGVAVLGSNRLADLVRGAVRASGLPSADTPYYPVVLRCEPNLAVPAGRQVVDIRPDGGMGDVLESADAPAETWVLSEASRHAVRRAGGRPTRVIVLPLPEGAPVDETNRGALRAEHGVAEEFVFGAFVDHRDERRNNVLGLVNAFYTAFPEHGDVRLLISVTGAHEYPEAAERLRLATVSDPRVVLVEEDAEAAVLDAADCVVSLHRAEDGAGGDAYALRLLEFAARGVPVLASDHGAVAELLGWHGAKLISCHGAGEPGLDAAVAVLHEAADAPEGLRDFGRAAQEYLLAEHSVARAGERLRDRVEHAYRGWRSKWSKGRQGQPDDPLRPLLIARHALHRPPEVGVDGRHGVAPAMRKAVLRALSHYDTHIREVLRSLVDGVEQTSAELLRRQSELHGSGESDLDSLRVELLQLRRRQDQLDARCEGTDNGLVGMRADVADQQRRLREFEERLSGPSGEQDRQLDAMADRMDRLTSVLERTLDRIDALENAQPTSASEEFEAALSTTSGDAARALRRTEVLQRILLREHERNGAAHDDGLSAAVLCDAGLLRLPAQDGAMLPWLSSHTSWDTEASELIDSLLEPDGVFLDVGAYVGYQTVRVLSRLGTSGTVVAVEPCADSRALLRRNIEVNVPASWGRNVTVLGEAAWDSAAELLAQPSEAGGIAVSSVPGPDTTAGMVRSIRLDKALDGVSGQQPLSVVHVDVGGRVHRVLGGLVRLLRRDRPSIVCSFTPSAIEELGDDPTAALREFNTWGYDLVPVGRTDAVVPDRLLQAMAASATSSVKLWLRPRTKA